jgi:peroxiredoxin
MSPESPAPDSPASAPDFALPDHGGRVTTIREFRGRTVVLFFIRAFG